MSPMPALKVRQFGKAAARVAALAAALSCLGLPGMAAAQPAAVPRPRPAPFTSEVERCIRPAAEYHRVNADVLRAILRVESGLRPSAIGRNTNGTIDVGIGQINSIHFGRLAQHGIAPGHLLDACVGTYVAAWHLGQLVEQHGWSWQTIGRYHSATPQHNRRYQWLVYNELRRSGALAAQDMPLAAPQHAPVWTVDAGRITRQDAAALSPSLVFDAAAGDAAR